MFFFLKNETGQNPSADKLANALGISYHAVLLRRASAIRQGFLNEAPKQSKDWFLLTREGLERFQDCLSGLEDVIVMATGMRISPNPNARSEKSRYIQLSKSDYTAYVEKLKLYGPYGAAIQP